jgi:hypothetical protein
MDEDKKKPIMIGVIVVCFIAAGAIYLKTRPDTGTGDIPDYLAKQEVWLKCRNPDCEHEYQIVKKDYYAQVKEFRAQNPGVVAVPGLTCPNCGEPSCYEATKCEKCGTIFEKGTKRGDYEDRCPKCGYSRIEAIREAAAATKGGRGTEGR